MIVLDSSAVLATLLSEPQGERIADIMDEATQLAMSPANALECVLRLASGGRSDRSGLFDQFIADYEVALPSTDIEQLQYARAGFIAFGKGRHPAALNFGDCFAYALAKSRDAPLLFVGDDFSKTDVKRAL